MDANEYRIHGKELIDYIANSRRVLPDVEPGFLFHVHGGAPPPATGEPWANIKRDFDQLFLTGTTHWQSPHMHAYFPALNSYPSLLGEMLASAINSIGFTWAAAPAATELEMVVTDWLANMIGLPQKFLHCAHREISNDGLAENANDNTKTRGGGVLQTTVSESTLICMLAARARTLDRCRLERHQTSQQQDEHTADALDISRLVAYGSTQSHSSLAKAAQIALVRLRLIETDAQFALDCDRLLVAMEGDVRRGLVPFFVCATLGTTASCAFDRLDHIGTVLGGPEFHSVWLHVDAAYAGSAFLCDEYRHLRHGVEFASSFVFNPSKWMLVNFDCTAMWVDDSHALHRALVVDKAAPPLYLSHSHQGTNTAPDYMHWQLGLSKRCRSVKLWCVVRSYGVDGLRRHIRRSVQLAERFQRLVEADERFQVPVKRQSLGLVVFRLRGADDSRSVELLRALNKRGRVSMVAAVLPCLQGGAQYVLRFVITSQYTTEADVDGDWGIIEEEAGRVLEEEAAFRRRSSQSVGSSEGSSGML